MHPFIQVVHSISPLSPEAQEAILVKIQAHHLPKNTGLLTIGKISRRLYFIQKGLARVYYFKKDIDVTDYFAMENQFIGAVKSLFNGEPSRKGIQLLEDSMLYSIDIQDLEALSMQYHDIERAGRKIAIWGFLESQERLESIQFLEGKERYEELEKRFPGLLQRVPLKYIASYLGITQVSLSRIRAGK